jgi:hypothetical protein
MEEKPRTTPYPLRMPDELRVKLEKAAQAKARSLHAEIVTRLAASFALEIKGKRTEITVAQTVDQLELRVEALEAQMSQVLEKKG